MFSSVSPSNCAQAGNVDLAWKTLCTPSELETGMLALSTFDTILTCLCRKTRSAYVDGGDLVT